MIEGIGVVALLHAIADDPVATARPLAAVATAVAVDIVMIVTLFNAGPDDAVTTNSLDAVISAGIVVVTVAVVTLFRFLGR